MDLEKIEWSRIWPHIIRLVSLSVLIGLGFMLLGGAYLNQEQGVANNITTAMQDTSKIGTEEHLYLPINVTRISIQDYLLFKYESRGDEESILYLIGGQREKEVQNPTGNIIFVYPIPVQRFSIESPSSVAELIITRNNGTIEKYSLPIIGGEVHS